MLIALLLACSKPSEAPQWGGQPWEDVLELNDAGDGWADLAAPPPPPPPLQATPLRPGTPWTLQVRGAPPAATVHFALSQAGLGPGPCLPVALGGCLGVRDPVIHLGTTTAGADGLAVITVQAPASLSARYAAQALVAPTGGEMWFTTRSIELAP